MLNRTRRACDKKARKSQANSTGSSYASSSRNLSVCTTPDEEDSTRGVSLSTMPIQSEEDSSRGLSLCAVPLQSEGGQLVATDEEALQARSPRSASPYPAEIDEARMQGLPDLKGRLIKEGLLQEYLHYRKRYLEWRQGGNSGAAGEISEIGTQRRSLPDAHELWHPTPQKFDFFFTVSYWVAVLNIAGPCFLFFANIASFFDHDQALSHELMAHIRFMGNMCYTAGAYLAYFEIINISHGEKLVYFFPAWDPLREKLSPESWIGTLAYLIGMLVWDVGAFVELLPYELEGGLEILLVKVPGVLGGLAFTIGGLCELLHNRGRSPRQLEWKLSVVDCTGDVLCFVGVFLGFNSSTAKACKICFIVALGLFLVAGIMMLVMWRGNDFGLKLLRQLNDALRAGSFVNLNVSTAEGGLQMQVHLSNINERHSSVTRPAATKSRLSTRGVIFIVVYIWLGVCSTMNGAASFYAEEGPGRHFTDAMDSLLWSLVVLTILIIHSAVTSIPNQQPYRFAMMLVRFTLSVAAIAETASLAMWLPNQKHPTWHSVQGFLPLPE